ncbi:MAG: outer membrane protein assembly factor BamB family protein [Planctomycetota bacterium]|jgi:outer membrane protein assembly factor BamB
MQRHIFFIVFALFFISTASCDRDTPVPDKPASEAELQQFKNPLALAGWRERGSWPQFAHDPLHSGRSEVDLGTSDLELAWQFRPTTHVWNYQPGFSVWSSPVAGTVAGRPLVIAGYYDRNVYAIDGQTGDKVWEFRPGAPVFASPALALVNGRPLVFVASLNRSIYGLDAATGQQVWRYETMPWSFTQASSNMSSPTVIHDRQNPVLIIGVWNSDRSASRNLQSGEVMVLNAVDGTLRWRKRLGSVPIGSPMAAQLDQELSVFVTSQNGIVYMLNLADGSIRWTSVLNEETRSSGSLGLVDGMARLFVGTRLHSIFALDCRTGARRWQQQTGYWIDSTPAWFVTPTANKHPGQTTLVIGSYDRSVYAWRVSSDRQLWKTTTGNYAYSSAAVASIGNTPVVLAMSWDEHIYLLNGLDGEILWKAKGGPLLWSHAFMGDSLWASPVVAAIAGKPSVIFAAYNGVLYAYRPRPSKKN